jgi:protein TonB
MLAAPYPDSSYRYRASVGTRVLAALIAIGIIGLMILMLMQLGVLPAIAPKEEVKSTTFTLTPAPKRAPSPTKSPVKTKRVTSGGAPRQRAPVAKAPPPTLAPPVPWNVIPLTKQEFASSDIAKLHSNAPASDKPPEGGSGSGTGRDSGKTYGPGDGPGGVQLYNAEWYVRPTDAQMAFYMPKTNTGSGWGDVACKTADHYHVEDCQELGESPGSGFARAVRQAAWQFLVRPPRIDGKPQIGAWVRIHYVFTERGSPE